MSTLDQTSVIDLGWSLGRIKPALLSSKEYSLSPLPRGTKGVMGVMAICIVVDTVEGVASIGNSIVFGVSFPWKTGTPLLGVATRALLQWRLSINSWFLFSSWRLVLALDDNEEDISERGVLVNLDSVWRWFDPFKKGFFDAIPQMSLLPTWIHKQLRDKSKPRRHLKHIRYSWRWKTCRRSTVS